MISRLLLGRTLRVGDEGIEVDPSFFTVFCDVFNHRPKIGRFAMQMLDK